MLGSWQSLAASSDQGHLLGEYGQQDSWALLYNIYADKLIGTDLVTQAVRLPLSPRCLFARAPRIDPAQQHPALHGNASSASRSAPIPNQDAGTERLTRGAPSGNICTFWTPRLLSPEPPPCKHAI